MSSGKEILKMDLYGLLGVEGTATLKEIKKAYRQKALTCHPDKNPDDPKAAELFHQLSQALEVLTDAAARAAYDKVQAAKKQAEERNRRLDDKRKKLKLDLEAREREAEERVREEEAQRKVEQEINRLREEGERMLEEEYKRLKKEHQEKLQRFYAAQKEHRNITPKLKIQWKCKKGDETNGGYSQEVLQGLFMKYGEVLNVVVLSTKKGRALVEFATVKAAERAFNYESGLTENPLKITWVEGKPQAPAASSSAGAFPPPSQSSLINESDYESLVLTRMRQAAERQRLIEQMQKEDKEEEDGQS